MNNDLLPPDILNEFKRQLPLTLSLPLSKAGEEFNRGNYHNTLLRILDFFEMSVQWLNCYFLGFARTIDNGGSLKGVERAVKIIDSKRPLSFGDSVNEIFNPILDSLSKASPEHPLVKSLSTHVKTRKTDIIVGSAKTRGVIKIRNDYKGHALSLSQTIYREVVEEITPKLEAFLEGIRPLFTAGIHAVDSQHNLVSLQGEWTRLDQAAPDSMDPGHYYVDFPGLPTVDLYPLVMTHDDRYVFVFQTLKDEKAKYDTSDDNVTGFETDTYNKDIDTYLQKLVPSFDIAKESNWEELCQYMHAHSAAYMVQVQKEKKYSSELFVDREHLTSVLEEFVNSPATLLPMSGDAGQGKTNQLCHWTETFLDQGQPVLIFSCSSFADNDLETTIKQIFGIGRRRPLEKILDHLHDKATEAGNNIIFLFDAVNECLDYKSQEESPEDAPLRLYRDIVSALVSGKYPHFKVISTCRSYTWKNQISPHILLDEALVMKEGDENAQILGFSDRETETAYKKYSRLYQMATDFETLDRRVMLRLRDPLIMKFTCSNYIGKPLDVTSDHYTSISLFEKMIEDIRERSFAGKRQYELLMEFARIIMVSYMNGEPAGSIDNTRLQEAYPDPENPLHRLSEMIYQKDGLTVAYTELRNKPDRPILRESVKTIDGHTVRSLEFIYERFLEYMMALAFHQLWNEENGSGTDSALTAGYMLKALNHKSLNVVMIGALRNALLIDIRNGEYDTLMELISLHQDKPGVLQIVNEVFDIMIQENYEFATRNALRLMLEAKPDRPGLVEEFNAANKEIAANRATPETIAKRNRLSAELSPVVRLRNYACVTVNNMLLSDYFNENLYHFNLLENLWSLVTNDIVEVSDETCKFIYYLSKRTHTNSHLPLNENLTKHIIREMYSAVRKNSIAGNVIKAPNRQRAVKFTETATRLAVLLLIDATTAPQQDEAMIMEMLDEIRGIANYFTWNFRLVRMVLPFLQTIMRHQLTFQSVYVNNIVEYQGYWNDSVVPSTAPDGEWCRRELRSLMEFVGFHERHKDSADIKSRDHELKEFHNLYPTILSAYRSGCSFTYFILERIMIIVGADNWDHVRGIFNTIFEEYRDFEWFDYLQMSLLYSLLQLQLNGKEHNEEIMRIYADEARDWTLRCRGLFKARHVEKANALGYYKRNVLNWYCVAYCSHHGDNVSHSGDRRPVPLLYELIDMAVADNDKELLFHIIDNIEELVSDFGYVRTALAALKHILSKYESQSAVDALDNAGCRDNRWEDEKLGRKIGNVLSTTKTYFPAETDAFLRSDIVGLKFPGIQNYTDQILSFHPSGETLSDLFTHRFGNFLLWVLMNEKAVDDFAYEAVCSAIDSKDCVQWFDKVIRILFQRMFNVKL